MLSIKIGNSYIPVASGISLSLVLRSPLFLTQEGRSPGSYIFNTRFPATVELRTEFEQAHRVQRHGRATVELPYEIREGILSFLGNCIVTQADALGYEIAFKVDNGDFASRLKDKTLKDLDWGNDIVVSEVCSIAHDRGFYRNVYGPTDLRTMSFDTIEADVSGSFNVYATVFTATTASTVRIRLNFTLRNVNAVNMAVRFYRQDGSFLHFPIDVGYNEIQTSIACVPGDTITAKVYSEIGSWSEIKYTINYTFIQYTSANVFDHVATSTDQNSSPYAIFPIYNSEFLVNFPDDAFELDNFSLKTLYSEYFPIMNYYKDGEFPLFMTGMIEDQMICAANLFTPFVYLKTILEKIVTTAGYRLVNSPFDAPEFFNAVLFNAYAENNYSGEATTITPVKPTFNLADHVPAMEQGDFINWISQFTGYMPLVDNNYQTVTFVSLSTVHLESQANPSKTFPGILLPNPKVKVAPEYSGIKLELKAATSDRYVSDAIKEIPSKLNYKGSVWRSNELPQSGNAINDMYLVRWSNEFYVWMYNKDTYTLTWVFFSKDFPLVYLEGKEPYLTISTELSPIITFRTADTNLGAVWDRLFIIPKTLQAGILEGFAESFSTEYGRQVLIYKGMTNDLSGNPYPYGTSLMQDYPGNTLPGINLDARSIFNNRYKQFLQWLAYETKPVTFQVILTPKALRGLNFGRIYRAEGFSFMIKEIRVNILYDHLSVTEMDVYTV